MFTVGRTPQFLRLLRGEPIPEPDSELLDALDASNAGGQIGTQKPAIRRFVGETADGPEPEIDRTRSQVARFQVDAIPEDNGTSRMWRRHSCLQRRDSSRRFAPLSRITWDRRLVVRLVELRLFNTADLAWSRSGSRTTVFGVLRDRLGECFFDIGGGLLDRTTMMRRSRRPDGASHSGSALSVWLARATPPAVPVGGLQP
jgi:hypothetical protein